MDLFTHEQEYRTEGLLKKMSLVPIVFAGCGAIGSNLADNMARQGFKNMYTIDMDRVEDHNKGTQLWDRLDVGKLKTACLKTKIYNSTGTVVTQDFNKKLTEDNIGKVFKKFEKEIIIDSFDNTEGRSLLHNYCHDFGLNCLHVGLFKDYAEVIWNDYYTVPGEAKGMDICEYPLARNIILLAVAVASETVIKFVDSGVKKNYTITLKDLKIKELDV